MNRTFSRIKMPATRWVLAAAAAAVPLLSAACLPSPDISGLPPYEGGVGANSGDSDGAAINLGDGGGSTSDDATLGNGNDSGTGMMHEGDGSTLGDGSSSGGGFGQITGVVVDYAQGQGVGVLAGATVTVAGVTSTTTIADGTFTLSSVPAGTAYVSVSYPSQTADGGVSTGIAYGTTEVAVQVAAGQTTTVSPVVHEGCFQVVDLSAVDGGADGNPLSVTLAGACGTTGASARVQFAQDSFQTTANVAYTGAIRIEMIPLAYPVNSGATDLTWATALPGAASPAGAVGAAEYRVVAAGTGEPLIPRAGANVSIDVPVFPTAQQLAGAGTITALQYAPGSGWASASPTTGAVDSDAGPNPVVTLSGVTSFGWWSLVAPTSSTVACVRGKIVLGDGDGDAGVAGLTIRAVGANYLGASTATTAANGDYCLDVPANGFQGAAEYDVLTRDVLGVTQYVPSAGGPYLLSPTRLGNTCASAGNCTIAKDVTLVPATTCAQGTLVATGAAIPTSLDVEVKGLQIATSEMAAGIRPNAYVGQTTPTGAGFFCALVPPSSTFALQAPGDPTCASGVLTAPAATGTPATCGGGACSSVGSSLPYTCTQ